MNGIDVLRQTMQTSFGILEPLLDDMADNPLATPTADGGNHPLWIAGHIAVSEASMRSMVTGEANPLEHWNGLFSGGTTPIADASIYPGYDEVRAELKKTHEQTLKVLDTLTDADLDKDSINCPDEWKPYFGTFGKVLTIIGLHPMHHCGQVADVRRAQHKQPIMA